MALMKRIASIAVVTMTAFALVGCGGNKTVKKDYGETKEAEGIYPREIEKMMTDRDYKSAIKDVGMGTHTDKIMALKKARMDADVKIARQFEQEVSSLRKSYVEMIGDKALDHQQETNETFSLIKLRGAEVVKELVTEGKDGYQAYVMTIVTAERMKQLADEQANALTEFKATQAYKDLESRVAEEKAARAASAAAGVAQ